MTAPSLILDGDDDQIVSISASALLSSMLIKKAALNRRLDHVNAVLDTLIHWDFAAENLG